MTFLSPLWKRASKVGESNPTAPSYRTAQLLKNKRAMDGQAETRPRKNVGTRFVVAKTLDLPYDVLVVFSYDRDP